MLMKIFRNPLLWIALGLMVFAGLYLTNTPADSVWAAVLFLPCLVMTILTGIGAFKWKR